MIRNLGYYRLKHFGCNHQQFSELIRASSRTVDAWERGEELPSPRRLEQLAKFFDEDLKIFSEDLAKFAELSSIERMEYFRKQIKAEKRKNFPNKEFLRKRNLDYKRKVQPTRYIDVEANTAITKIIANGRKAKLSLTEIIAQIRESNPFDPKNKNGIIRKYSKIWKKEIQKRVERLVNHSSFLEGDPKRGRFL